MQSQSFAAAQPVGQQPSLVSGAQAVIGTWRQAAVHEAASPISRSAVQGSPSSGQDVGQLAGGSQVSPAPTCPSPQRAGPQSLSVVAEQPAGQQPSPERQAVIGWWKQARVQVSSEPAAKSRVHASASSQLRGHAPGAPVVIARSQVSPSSTLPLPQMTRQSLSSSAEQPAGQQPSPSLQALIAV